MSSILKEYIYAPFIPLAMSRISLWFPTEDEIRKCCGVWAWPSGLTKNVTPDALLGYDSCDDAISRLSSEGGFKLEPIPEQLIPKFEPEKPVEYYQKHVYEWL